MRIAIVGRFKLWPWGQHPDEAYLADGLECAGSQVVRLDQDFASQPLADVDWVLFTGHPGSHRQLTRWNAKCRTILWTLDWIPDYPERLPIVDVARNATFFVTSDRFDWEKQFQIINHIYLPGACEGEEPHFRPRARIPCAFLGSIYNERRKRISDVVRSMGGEVLSHGGSWVYQRKLAIYVQRTRVIVGDNARNDVEGYWSSRNYVIPGAGGFLLTPAVAGLDQQFGIGIHLAVYHSLDELGQKLKYWIHHDQEREEIRKAGFHYVRKNHTWKVRAERLLEFIAVRSQHPSTTYSTSTTEASAPTDEKSTSSSKEAT